MRRTAPSKRIRILDAWVIALVTLLFILSLFPVLGKDRQQDSVTVRTDSDTFTLDTSADREVSVSSGGYNYVITVRGGTVSVSDADCPDGICASSAPIGSGGKAIVCAPGKLVISSHDGVSDSDGWDVKVP